MSETAKWQLWDRDGLVGGRISRGRFVDGNYEEERLEPEYVNSLETSLAEAQKERDEARRIQEHLAHQFGLWRMTARVRGTRLQATEQQLAEVKAQLDAQAGVIGELLGLIRDGTLVVSDEDDAAEVAAIQAACLVGDDLLAHVREPETK